MHGIHEGKKREVRDFDPRNHRTEYKGDTTSVAHEDEKQEDGPDASGAQFAKKQKQSVSPTTAAQPDTHQTDAEELEDQTHEDNGQAAAASVKNQETDAEEDQEESSETAEQNDPANVEENDEVSANKQAPHGGDDAVDIEESDVAQEQGPTIPDADAVMHSVEDEDEVEFQG